MIRSTAWLTFLSILFYKGVVVIWREQISLVKSSRTRVMKINWTFYAKHFVVQLMNSNYKILRLLK